MRIVFPHTVVAAVADDFVGAPAVFVRQPSVGRTGACPDFDLQPPAVQMRRWQTTRVLFGTMRATACPVRLEDCRRQGSSKTKAFGP